MFFVLSLSFFLPFSIPAPAIAASCRRHRHQANARLIRLTPAFLRFSSLYCIRSCCYTSQSDPIPGHSIFVSFYLFFFYFTLLCPSGRLVPIRTKLDGPIPRSILAALYPVIGCTVCRRVQLPSRPCRYSGLFQHPVVQYGRNRQTIRHE